MNRRRKKRKQTKAVLIILIMLLLLGGSVVGYRIYSEKIAEKKEENLKKDIATHYNKYIKVTKDTDLYKLNNNKYEKIGKITKDQELTLSDIEPTIDDTYFKIDSLEGEYYIYYKDVSKIEALKEVDARYKNYLPFNKNIITNEITNFYDEDDFHVFLYSNDPQVNDIELNIKLSQLDEFFNTRYGYLTELIKKIDKIDNHYEEKFKKEKIRISDDPITQIQILLEENQKRTNSEYYDSTLHRLKSFFETEFHCPENKKLVKEFENQLKYGIKEVMNAIQNNTFFTPYIDSLLEPTYKPRINGWGYAYGKFFERVFIGGS